MTNLNSVIIEGNLTRDADIKYSSTGSLFCVFSIATNRYYKQDNEFKTEVSYFDAVVFGKPAEYAQEKLKKGRGVRIIGRLKQDRWSDESGNTKTSVKIIADRIDFSPEKKQTQDDFSSDF